MPTRSLSLAIPLFLSFISGCGDPALPDQGSGLQFQKQPTSTTVRLWRVGPGTGIGSPDLYVESDGSPTDRIVLHYDPASSTWLPSNARAPTDGCLTCKAPGFAVAAGVNFAAAAEGHVSRFDASGGTVLESTGLSDTIYALWGDPSGVLIAVGFYGGIARRSPTGTWRVERAPSPDNHPLNAVWGLSPTSVYAVGEVGTILHYDGTAWTMEESGTQSGLADLWGSATLGLFTAGDAGTILHKQKL